MFLGQYYFTNEGRHSEHRRRSHIGVFTMGASIGARWSLSATLPLEAERNEHEDTGMQDVVLGIRYFPELQPGRSIMVVLTVEPPTGNGVGRTESSFEEGEKRGDRIFLGGGLAYEGNRLPFSPQLGVSW